MVLEKTAGHGARAYDQETVRALGRQLRAAREARGEELAAAASELYLRPAYLEAIEEGELGRIPAGAYHLGFLGSYARHLGFDGADLVKRLTLPPEPPARPPAMAGGPAGEGTRHRARMTLAALLLVGASLGVGGYYSFPERGWSAVVQPAAAVADPVPEAASAPLMAAAEAELPPAEPIPPVLEPDAVDLAASAQVAPLIEDHAAPPAPELAPIPPSAPPPARFTVHVALVRDPAQVPVEWQRLARLHPSLAALEPDAARTVDVPGKGTFYRVAGGTFATRAEAQAACARLAAEGRGCRAAEL